MRHTHVFALVAAALLVGYGSAVMIRPAPSSFACGGVDVEGTCISTSAYLGMLRTVIAANAY